jgi:hypothetical protein
MGSVGMMIIDNFLESYGALKDHIRCCNFSDIANPVDGVVYPFINLSVPDVVRSELDRRIESIIGRAPENSTVFLRRSPKGVSVPHVAHTDISMGRLSLMLYCNEYEGGGTAFLRHRETGICYSPESQEYVELMQKDQNSPDKWAVVDMAHMEENRAVIFDAGKFHCAMPVGGFGEGFEARTVLTVFFS